MLRFSRHLVIGLVVLGAVYLLLGALPFPVMVLAYLLHLVTGGLNLFWFAAIIGVIAFGLGTRRPGFAAAPFVLAAIWFSVSFVERTRVQATADPALADRSVPADLRTVRTLILDQQGEGCCGQFKLLADGAIDTYVFSDRNDSTGVRGDITAYRLARIDQCSAEDIQRSSLLAKAGRTDECFAREKLAALPDGLVLRMKWMRAPFGVACCNEGQMIQRSGGVETLRGTWHFGRQLVPSFFPMLGFAGLSQPTGLWDSAPGGPAQIVWAAGPSFDTKDMVAAIYGIGWLDPISIAKVTPAERLARAQALSRRPNFGDRLLAVDVAMTLAAEGHIDEDLIRLMVSYIEYDTVRDRMASFYSKLTPAQRDVFTEAMMARIQEPTAGMDFTRLNFAFIPHPPQGSPLRQTAQAIYSGRPGLKVWQYQAALKLAQDPKAGFGTPAYREQQRRYLHMLLDDNSPSFTPRTIAFLATHPVRTDEERQAIGERLDLVPDERVEEIVRANWHRTVYTNTTTEATLDFRRLALARIERIADDKLRREAQEHYRNRND